MVWWMLWVVLAVVLLGIEATTTAFVAVYFGVAAAATAVVAALGLPTVVQVLAFAALSLGGMVLTRPALRRLAGSTPRLRTGVDAMRGRKGVVTTAITGLDSGQVRVGGETWSARNYFEGESIGVGATIEIVQVEGVTALVIPAPSPDELSQREESA